MRLKTYLNILSLVSLLLIGSAWQMPLMARTQQQDEEINVRGAFLTSRPSTESSKKPPVVTQKTPVKRKTVVKPTTTNTQNSNQTGPNAATVNQGNSSGAAHTLENNVIGLGYTLYMRDPVGDAVRVDPTSEFRAGDRIRLVLEPNIDGYLYVFHTENDGEPHLIFPDIRLDQGDNTVRAHVPYEVPSSRETDERLRWFVFDQQPAKERLYVFVSREPIAGVPSGPALVNYCQTQQQAKPGVPCLWQPAPSLWAQIKADSEGRAQVSKSREYGQTQTSGERQATTRGLGLSQAAPAPSVVHMNASSSANVLGTTVDLVHH